MRLEIPNENRATGPRELAPGRRRQPGGNRQRTSTNPSERWTSSCADNCAPSCTIFVTHDQDEALTTSDRIAVMNVGRIEPLGVPEDSYERPRARFVARLLGWCN